MSSIDVGLGYDIKVILTCKLLHKLCLLNLFFFRTKGGAGGSSEPPNPSSLRAWSLSCINKYQVGKYIYGSSSHANVLGEAAWSHTHSCSIQAYKMAAHVIF